MQNPSPSGTTTEPGFERAAAVVLSPSQIKTWLSGKRRWAWQYLARKPRKSSASADLGTAVHQQLERHLRGEGFDYSTAYKKRAAEIAMLGVPHLPAPRTAGMVIENRPVGAPLDAKVDKYFSFQMSNDIVYRGTMDLTVPDSIVVPGLWGGAPACVDHKTTGNIALYALSEEDLHTDVQAVIYAYYLMSLYRSPVADLQWNYLSTKTKAASPRRLRVFSPRVVDEFGRIHTHGTEMSSTYLERPNPLDLPPCRENAGTGGVDDPCEAYGGCPFKDCCTDVFSPMGFPVSRPVSMHLQWAEFFSSFAKSKEDLTMTQMNGTAEGQARMAALEAQAPPDPYVAYAAWRATVPAAPTAPGYEALEARYQASIVPPAPVAMMLPPALPAAPPALPPGITNAPADFVPRPFLLAGAVPVLPAINPPEYQAAPTLEQRASVLTPAPKEAKKTRTRRTNEQIAADKATAPKEFTLYVVEADGTLTTEVIVAAAVFVR